LNQGTDVLVQSLTDTLFHPPERELTVVVRNLPDLNSYQQVKTQLKALRWVKQVVGDNVGYHPVKTVFNVTFAQRPELFADMLGNLRDYRLIDYSRQTFTLTVKEI
jgi:hypothetical protein